MPLTPNTSDTMPGGLSRGSCGRLMPDLDGMAHMTPSRKMCLSKGGVNSSMSACQHVAAAFACLIGHIDLYIPVRREACMRCSPQESCYGGSIKSFHAQQFGRRCPVDPFLLKITEFPVR